MGYTIPSVQDLAVRTRNSFRKNLPGSDASLAQNNIYVTAKVIAGAVWEPFSFLAYISKQMFAQSADGEWLDRHGKEYGIVRLAPSLATGSVDLTGVANTVVPSGLELARTDGALYEITTGGIVSGGGAITVSVRAKVAGKAGNSLAGTGMTLTTPYVGLDSSGSVHTDGIGGGADEESDERLRSRILHRKRFPPHGGAVFDYVQWVREALASATRVFVDPVTNTNGRTSVGVYFLLDDTYPNGIPQTADIDAVAAYIEIKRPAGARVEVLAPTPVSVDITIQGLTPDTTDVRDAIALEVADMFLRVGRVSTDTDPFVLHKSKIVEAISIATGEDHHTLTAPAADTAFSSGEVPVLGTISYV